MTTIDMFAEQDVRRALPRGWRWERLGDIATYINGMAFKPDDWETAGLPIIRIQNLTNPNAPFNYFSGQFDDRYQVEYGDLLISWSASLDAFIWQRGPAILNQHIFKAIENPAVVTRDYLYFAVRESMDEIRAQVHGATMRHITRPEFEAIRIPLPPLPEQRRIAALLADQLGAVERAHAAAVERLAAAQALPAAYLRAVFESEEARRWPRKRLGDVCEFIGGMQPPKHTFKYEPLPGYIRLVQIQDFRRSDVAVYIPQEEAKRTFFKDDVMIGRYGPPVFQILRGLAGSYNVALMKASPKDGLLKNYLYYLLQEQTIQKAVIAQSERSAGQSGVQKEFLENFNVLVPSLDVQERVARTLDVQREELKQLHRALQSQIDSIDKLPAALLRRAFNGEL